MSESVREDFVQKIERAFAETPYPGDDRLAAGYWPLKDSDELVRDLKGQHWSELSRNVLFRYRGGLGGFTPDAFRFYLPAFLRAAVLYPVEMDTLLDSLFYYLVPPESTESFNLKIESITNQLEQSDLPPSDVANLIRPLRPRTDEFEKQLMDLLLARANAFDIEEKEVILAYFESYAELYPDDAEFLTDSDRSELQRAVDFWKSIIE